MGMDKQTKIVLYFLKYLSQKTNFQEIDFEKFKEIAIFLGFKDIARNEYLFNFYNEKVHPKVIWESFDLSRYSNSFLNKIKLIAEGKAYPIQLFNDPIDDKFSLGEGSHRDNTIDFYETNLTINFHSKYSEFLLDLISLNDDEMRAYYSAVYNGDCYIPDFSSDSLEHAFNLMDNDCRVKLKEIVTALGKVGLANKIGVENFREVIHEIIRLFDQILGKRFVRDIYDDYATATNEASCQSVKDAFRDHFPEGISLENGRQLEIEYTFLINFLEKNPQIQTFSDLEGVNLIDSNSYIDEAYYDYDIDIDNYNRNVYYILDNAYDKIMDDENTIKLVENLKEFENIMKSLKFKFSNGDYLKVVPSETGKKRFKISVDSDVDFNKKKVILNFAIGSEIKTYKIPFDEISDYVTTEKLHETIKMKIRKYLL